ncbi:MAG: hypothetical protein FJX76_11545 [Armatimonadetes bacterium]|nr:hypothetical protein [Armatimonadota bacterium]
MLRWLFTILVVLFLAAVVGAGGWFVYRERPCLFTNQCEARLQGLQTQLEFYSVDEALEQEKRAGKSSERRAFYPATIDELEKGRYVSAANTRCPVYLVEYVYVARENGRSYLAYCPARHSFHFDGTPFCPAVTPDQRNLHLAVKGGRVLNLIGSHDNPWDFRTGGRLQERPTDVPASMIKMLASNPPPQVKF